MGSKASNREMSKELARELLISISSTLSYEVMDLDKFRPSFERPNRVVAAKDDRVEKYRADLISISYAQSPDVK
ncbi:hypothetical protein Pint_03391 [Pistacia integerrima]|uniref:Uncharacterized protein n=1 Tax=Pistacia integerrima TaxID=434235 RepID=A0ACC0ZJJ4_9ROSI|nr:hypothetical protein Pint_03391 [Pistacia integerrima]